MQTRFTTRCLWWLGSRCFPNPCQSDIWWLTIARRNSYQPVLVRIFRNCAIVEALLPFMTCRKTYRLCIVRTSLSDWSFLFMIYVNCGAIAVITSTTYTTIAQLFDEYSAPFPWADKVIDHDTNIYIEWHNIIHGNRKECQSLLLRGIGSGPGPSSPPSCFLFLAWWLKPNTHTPGLSWPTITRQIHDPFPCIQTTTSA